MRRKIVLSPIPVIITTFCRALPGLRPAPYQPCHDDEKPVSHSFLVISGRHIQEKFHLFDEAGDAGMAGYMRGDMLPDPGPLRKPPELHGYRSVGTCCLMLRNEDRHIIGDRFCRIVVLPFCQGLAGHDDKTAV